MYYRFVRVVHYEYESEIIEANSLEEAEAKLNDVEFEETGDPITELAEVYISKDPDSMYENSISYNGTDKVDPDELQDLMQMIEEEEEE